MTTPLTIKAFAEGLERFGTGSLADLIQPAIAYCEDGFIVRPKVNGFWHQPAQAGRIARLRVVTDLPATAKIYTKADGSLYNVGEVLKNPDMGRTYRRISEAGVEDFYTGDIARAIDADMRANGGHITLADLAACETEHTTPLMSTYRGYDVATNPPPGGGLMVVEMLNILENFDLDGMGHNSPAFIATVSEAMKIATVDKDQRMGDPRFVDIPMDELMSKDYAADIDPFSGIEFRRRQRWSGVHVQQLHDGVRSPAWKPWLAGAGQGAVYRPVSDHIAQRWKTDVGLGRARRHDDHDGCVTDHSECGGFWHERARSGLRSPVLRHLRHDRSYQPYLAFD